MLKRHKIDGTDLSADHLILSLPAIELFVADVFTSILRHDYMPSVLRDCVFWYLFPKETKILLSLTTIILLLWHQLLARLWSSGVSLIIQVILQLQICNLDLRSSSLQLCVLV